MLTQNSRTLLLIVNPASGKTKAKSSLYDLIAPLCEAGFRTTVYTTAARGEASEIARTLGAQYDRILCCGGDGTLNEVIDGMLRGDVTTPLGYVPAGSTNDFAATLGLTGDIASLVRTHLDGKPRPIDVGCFNGERHFTYIASFGAFTSSSYTAPQTAKNAIGHLAYVLEGIKDLPSLHPIGLTVETEEGEVLSGEFIFGAVSNSTTIGGVVKLDSSLVDLSDGKFEVLLIRMPKNLAELNRILIALTSRDYSGASEIILTRAGRIRITADEPIPWSLDGEYEKGGETAEIHAIPGAVTLMI